MLLRSTGRAVNRQPLRDELLKDTLFASLVHARKALALRRNDYNTIRPTSAVCSRRRTRDNSLKRRYGPRPSHSDTSQTRQNGFAASNLASLDDRPMSRRSFSPRPSNSCRERTRCHHSHNKRVKFDTKPTRGCERLEDSAPM
jgi:integrase-like protein